MSRIIPASNASSSINVIFHTLEENLLLIFDCVLHQVVARKWSPFTSLDKNSVCLYEDSSWEGGGKIMQKEKYDEDTSGWVILTTLTIRSCKPP